MQALETVTKQLLLMCSNALASAILLLVLLLLRRPPHALEHRAHNLKWPVFKSQKTHSHIHS